MTPADLQQLIAQGPERLPLIQSQLKPVDREITANLFPKARLSDAAQAGLLLRLGCWQQSHEIAQNIETPEGSYWHAIIHRMEPDAFNAQYWFRKMGRHAIFPALYDQAAAIIQQHGQQQWCLKTSWDPALFTEWCEEAQHRGGQAEAAAIEIQMAEWQLLFDWCAAPVG